MFMSKPRLTAQPIREGITFISGRPVVVWREFRWNTGSIVRDWHIDPKVARDLEITVLSVRNKLIRSD